MNSVVEAKVADYLSHRLNLNPYDCGTILEEMRALAHASGHELDDDFAQAGLGAGPEARVASRIVDLAMLGGGAETTEYAVRKEINDWLRRRPRKGLR